MRGDPERIALRPEARTGLEFDEMSHEETTMYAEDVRRRGESKPASTMFPIRLSVFFPCYNEEANVERVTLSALRACERLVDEYEVIIVNDGSKDRTGEIADQLAARHPHVRAVHNRPNRGYGGALQRGFREASMDWIFYTDGDGQFDFEELEQVLPMIELFDIVSAYRLNRRDQWNRKLNAWCWGKLVDALLHLRIRDVDCAFKVYPKSFIDRIEMRSTGALIDTEMLAKARRLGYRIGQIGVHHYPRTAGQQTGANFRVILKAFKELFKLHGHIRRTEKGAAARVGPEGVRQAVA